MRVLCFVVRKIILEYFFEQVRSYFEEDDLKVANCENTFEDNHGVFRDKSEDGGFWFKALAKHAEIFKEGGIDEVNISNNHTLDYGQDFLENIKEAIDAVVVMWVYKVKIIYYEKEGYIKAIIYSAFYNYYEESETIVYLKEAEENPGFQLVYFNGGQNINCMLTIGRYLHAEKL